MRAKFLPAILFQAFRSSRTDGSRRCTQRHLACVAKRELGWGSIGAVNLRYLSDGGKIPYQGIVAQEVLR